MRDVQWCLTIDYQQIENGNIANQIHGFTIDYGKFILIGISVKWLEVVYQMATFCSFWRNIWCSYSFLIQKTVEIIKRKLMSVWRELQL